MRKLLYLSGFLLLFSSCGWLNPSIMLRTGRGYKYSKFPDSVKVTDYKISENDILDFHIYSNDGFKLVDLTSLSGASGTIQKNLANIDYLVESDGKVKLPVLGRTKLSGLTIREAEVMLEESFSAFYIKPFVMLEVTNRRVIIFPGSAGDAKVIPLKNNNTTLLEALAQAGGISENGKAHLVKLIRQHNDTSEVYLIDLSKIKGLKQGKIILQANDMIYVEPRRRYASKFLQELAPVVSIITTSFVLITYSRLLTKK